MKLRMRFPAIGALIVLLMVSGSARADRIDDLSQVLATDSQPKIRAQAAAVLGRLRDRRGAPALMRALTDESETVRGVAAAALGEVGEPSALAALERSRRDPSPFVRDQAQTALEILRAARVASSGTAPRPRVASPTPTNAIASNAATSFATGGVRVEIGEVGSKTGHLPGDLSQKFRAVLHRELAAMNNVSVGTPGRFRVEATIVKLSRKTSNDTVEIAAEVSLIVGRAADKSIVMTSSGSATAQSPRDALTPEIDRAMQFDAVEGAVKGAAPSVQAFFAKQR